MVSRQFGLVFERIAGRYGDYVRLGTLGRDRLVAVRCEMGPFGSQGSAATALFASVETGCSALVVVGMCFGVSEGEQDFGDVLVSTALIPYDRRNVNAHESQPYQVDYSPAVWSSASPALVEVLRRAQATAARPYRVHFGGILSGGARIHSTRFRDELVERVPASDTPIVGGEMEGVGVLAASPPESPNWVIVKGISDFGDDAGVDNVKRHRQAACHNAVDYLFHALSNSEETR